MGNDEIIQKNNELFIELGKYPENSKKYQDTVVKIVENNLPLVIHIAKRYFPFGGSALDNDDLIAEGRYGLLYAIKSFNPGKDVPFSNYAAINIEGYIRNRLRQEEKYKTRCFHLEDAVATNNKGDQLKFEDITASPVDFATEIVEKDEKERQLTWVRKNLDRLTPLQRKVLISRYLLGEAVLTRDVLAKQLKRWPGSISAANDSAIAKLRKMYYQSYPAEVELKPKAEIELTPAEKNAMKQKLKKLVLTNLPPQQKKIILCKFYTAAKKTNQQVAQETNLSKVAVANHILKASKKLCTLYNRSQDQQQLTTKAVRNILKSGIETNANENEKER